MGEKYTREQLAKAVAGAETFPEVMRRLGVQPTKGRREYLRKLLKRWNIDSGHLRSAALRHTERELRKAAAASGSVAEVVRRLGLSPVGGNQAYIGRRLVEFGVETSHFSVKARRRSVPSGRPLLSLGSADNKRVPGERLRRALVGAGVREVCAECGTGPVWNGESLRLEVDHVNGDWWDNRRDNLRLLCPNCHAVTDTYRGRKRGPQAQREVACADV